MYGSTTTSTTTTTTAALKGEQGVSGSSALQSGSPGDSGKGANAAGIGNGNLYSSETRVSGGLQAQPSVGTVAVLRSLEFAALFRYAPRSICTLLIIALCTSAVRSSFVPSIQFFRFLCSGRVVLCRVHAVLEYFVQFRSLVMCWYVPVVLEIGDVFLDSFLVFWSAMDGLDLEYSEVLIGGD